MTSIDLCKSDQIGKWDLSSGLLNLLSGKFGINTSSFGVLAEQNLVASWDHENGNARISYAYVPPESSHGVLKFRQRKAYYCAGKENANAFARFNTWNVYGFDKGHMISAATFNFSKILFDSTMNFLNFALQYRIFNGWLNAIKEIIEREILAITDGGLLAVGSAYGVNIDGSATKIVQIEEISTNVASLFYTLILTESRGGQLYRFTMILEHVEPGDLCETLEIEKKFLLYTQEKLDAIGVDNPFPNCNAIEITEENCLAFGFDIPKIRSAAVKCFCCFYGKRGEGLDCLTLIPFGVVCCGGGLSGCLAVKEEGVNFYIGPTGLFFCGAHYNAWSVNTLEMYKPRAKKPSKK